MNKLTKEKREEYHSLTAQCLYLSKRVRPDLQTTISFHYSRVLAPDEDGDLKLARIIRCHMTTGYLSLIQRIDDNGVTQWWVDTLFAEYEDMCSRICIRISLGKGTMYGASAQQKINTGSFTHAEHSGVSDALPKIL